MKGKFVKQGALFFLFPALLISSLTACGSNHMAGPGGNNQGTSGVTQAAPGTVKSLQNPYNQNYDAAKDGTRHNAYTEADARSAIFVAKRVSAIAQSIPGVANASAAAQGIDVVIGIEGHSGQDLAQLEQQVFNQARQAEPGYNIYVTSNRGLTDRIRGMNSAMTNVRSGQVTPGISGIIYEMGRLRGNSR